LRQQLRSLDPAATSLGDTATDLVRAGIRRAYSLRPLDQWEVIFLFAVTQGQHSLRAAWECIYVGYNNQAMDLLRLVTEYVALARYVSSHRGEAEGWLRGATAPKTTGLLLQSLSADIERGAIADSLGHLRKLLHNFAHQNPVGLGLTFEELAETRISGFVGPHVDERAYRLAAINAVVLGDYLLEPMGDWFSGRGVHLDLCVEIDRYVKGCHRWLKEVETQMADIR